MKWLFGLFILPMFLFADTQIDVRGYPYSEIMGFGNLTIITSYYLPASRINVFPIVQIPKEDNFFECKLLGITMMHGKPFNPIFKVVVSSSVQADTGTCLIYIKHPITKRTVSIVRYGYILN